MTEECQDLEASSSADAIGKPDARLARLLSRLMTIGVVLAVLPMLAGAALAIADTGSTMTRLESLFDLPYALGALEPVGYVDLGILVLLCTPFFRVLVLLFAFARRKKWVFCGLGALVLTILVVSAVVGLRIE